MPKQSRWCVVAIVACLWNVAFAGIQVESAISVGLESPVFVGNAGDGSRRLFVVERGGIVRVLRPGASAPTVFIDIHDRLTIGDEEGLLGLAFHPQYATNGRFFLYYTRAIDRALVIAEYRAATNPDLADPTESVVLAITQPRRANHIGGMLAFGPDGYLYLAVGDGAAPNDPLKNAQNSDVLLGKMIRIDVDRPDIFAATRYSSPRDNPFVNGPGRDEIYAVGLRNPWRFSFDRMTGQLWLADVGEETAEEVNSPVIKGGNYGWRVYEGTICTNSDPALCEPTRYNGPLFQYGHTGGRCSITGGYVYRGSPRYECASQVRRTGLRQQSRVLALVASTQQA